MCVKPFDDCIDPDSFSLLLDKDQVAIPTLMKFINEKALVEHAEVIDLKMFNNENASNRDQLWLK